MKYKELKKVAQPHIKVGDNFPSNSFWLLNQLHIPFKNEKQCEEDYGKMNPLYNHPAFLEWKNEKGTIYFNSKTRYWNFYIFHEIAHYLLEHMGDSPENELDANMLACILAAPEENFPTTIKTAQDLSVMANIPIDRAEEYWQEIHDKKLKPKNKRILLTGIIIISALSLCFLTFKLLNPDIILVDYDNNGHIVSFCPQIKDRNNLKQIQYSQQSDDDFTHCKTCFLLKDLIQD